MKISRGFAMSLEAAASLLLLAAALSALPLFEVKSGSEPDFFLCSDAAMVLLKSGALSGDAQPQVLYEASQLSGLCLEYGDASSCQYGGEEKFSFTFAIWRKGSLQNATVSCWRH